MKPLSQYVTPFVMLTTAALAATKTTVSLDFANVIGNLITIKTGAYTDGKYVATVQDSTDNTTYAAVASGLLVFQPNTQTAVADVSSAATTGIQRFSYIGPKRYLQIVMTATTGTTGVLADIHADLMYRKLPTT